MTYTKQEVKNSVNHIITVHSGMYNLKELKSFLASKKWQLRYANKCIIEAQKDINKRRKDRYQLKNEIRAYEKAIEIHLSDIVK